MVAEGRTITQTASACGYSSASAFVTTFRAAFGQLHQLHTEDPWGKNVVVTASPAS